MGVFKIHQFILTIKEHLTFLEDAIQYYEKQIKEEEQIFEVDEERDHFGLIDWQRKELKLIVKMKERLLMKEELKINDLEYMMIRPFLKPLKK